MSVVTMNITRERKRVQSILEAGADLATLLPTTAAPVIARGMSRVASNRIAPLVVILLVSVVAFLALAVVIGAIGAYIWYCQSIGGYWPGFSVPEASGGVYRLGCFK